MNKLDRLELVSQLEKLKANKGLIENSIKDLPDVAESLDQAKKFEADLSENAAKIIEIENKLNEQQPKAKENNKMKYLETNNSVKDFFDTLKFAPVAENGVSKAWNAKLVENGITITDDTLQLPRKLVESIQSTLLNTNPVFKAFKVTHLGAVIVSQLFDSTDEALVHTAGTQKQIQAATLEIDSLKPRMIYKLQVIAEEVKRLNQSYEELYNFVVAEMTQAIVNKIVDLALIEGTADKKNGFVAVMEETDTKKVMKSTAATEADIVDAIESGVDFVRATFGKKYLIVTVEQRKRILKALRALNTKDYIRNIDGEIAFSLGLDELIVYTGTKKIKPIVLVDQKYHVDMQDLTKIDAFKWETNENAVLIESLSGGHLEALKSAAVIELPVVGE